MNKKILVINAGSSSIKFKVYDYEKLTEQASGLCERIFVDGAITLKDSNGQNHSKNVPMPNHIAAIQIALDLLKETKVIDDLNDIVGVGHRVVIGGSQITSSICVDGQKELDIIEKYSSIAPLHNPPEKVVILAFKKLIPNAKNVGVFDTSFHTTIPQVNSDYCLDRQLTTKYEIKRYGYHGTSYRYITGKMEQILNKKNPNLVVCHIGNGASICCVKNGKSYDTTMGFSPLEGIVMGTRCGDVDPSIILYLARQGFSIDQIDAEINKKGGLQGICGHSDLRDVCDLASKGDKNAILAREIQTQRIANYVVKYINELENKPDAIIFTAGCGENDGDLPSEVAKKIHVCKLDIDNQKAHDRSYSDFNKISTNDSDFAIYKVRTNEELMIATDTKNLINK